MENFDPKNEKEQKTNEELMNDSNSAKEDDGIVDKKTLKQYKVHWYNKIPYPVKSLFIKYWFFGLIYFLFMNGLGSLEIFRSETNFSSMTFVLIIITGLAIGVFNDLLVYNILDVIEDFPGQKDDYVIFKSRKIYSLFINIVYGVAVGFLGIFISGKFSELIDPTYSTFWFREPFTAALVLFVVDGIFIFIKDLIKHFVFKK